MYSNPMYCIVLLFLLNILCYKHSIGNCIVLVMYSNPMQIPPLHLSCHRYYQLLWAKRQTTLPLSSSGKGRKKKRLEIKNFAQITKLVSLPSVSLLIFIGPESDHWLCLSLTHSPTNSLLFSKLDRCDPGVWRCQLKPCWGCYCSWCWCLETCWR